MGTLRVILDAFKSKIKVNYYTCLRVKMLLNYQLKTKLSPQLILMLTKEFVIGNHL